ncbi:MAG: UDP-N-acetylmuramoyl-L-alanyl-D-glutamate--2,6-diaminopimelate ligase [bacterium]|nr:MAG: UDP-N-acetylmuramoyl-L-alanyl-D-glutamate--2,6-diaminopimelate ligase [bacterium]
MTGSEDVDVRGIQYDSRRIRAGDLFAAVPGESFNGSVFIDEARKKGAVSILVNEAEVGGEEGTIIFAKDVRRALAYISRNFHGDPSSLLKVVGITGTNGKTTTSFLIHGVLESAGIGAGLIGTVQYLVGGEVLSASRTTPESPDLNALLASMVSSGHKACILEVSSHALALERVTAIRMEVAVFTNLTRDHLDFHRDMEDYFQAKARLFLEGEVIHRLVNIDDPYGRRIVEDLGAQAVTFGMERGDVRPITEISSGRWGSRFTLGTPWGEVPVNTSLPGLFNISNIMGAVGTCGLLGLDVEAISRGISEVGSVPGRFQRVDEGQPYMAIVDYAHTPDALENLLRNVRRMTDGRVIVVFGCGGDRDRTKRPLMGRIAATMSEVAIVTSDNPRGEDPESIIADILSGMDSGGAQIRRIVDRREALAAAVREAAPGDTVVVAGKGHENYQILGERVVPFSDVDRLAEAIVATQGGVS